MSGTGTGFIFNHNIKDYMKKNSKNKEGDLSRFKIYASSDSSEIYGMLELLGIEGHYEVCDISMEGGDKIQKSKNLFFNPQSIIMGMTSDEGYQSILNILAENNLYLTGIKDNKRTIPEIWDCLRCYERRECDGN